MGSPRCTNIERTPAGAVTSASTFRLPPHRGQANTSSANLLRSSPAQSTRAVLCFLGSSTVAAKERLSFCGPASVPAFRVPLHLRAWLGHLERRRRAPGRERGLMTPMRVLCARRYTRMCTPLLSEGHAVGR